MSLGTPNAGSTEPSRTLPGWETAAMRDWRKNQSQRSPIVQNIILFVSGARNGILNARDSTVETLFRRLRHH